MEYEWSDDSHVTTMPWQHPSHNKQRREPAEQIQDDGELMSDRPPYVFNIKSDSSIAWL
jgi:hypothetical protein